MLLREIWCAHYWWCLMLRGLIDIFHYPGLYKYIREVGINIYIWEDWWIYHITEVCMMPEEWVAKHGVPSGSLTWKSAKNNQNPSCIAIYRTFQYRPKTIKTRPVSQYIGHFNIAQKQSKPGLYRNISDISISPKTIKTRLVSQYKGHCNICQKQSKPGLYRNISDVAISAKKIKTYIACIAIYRTLQYRQKTIKIGSASHYIGHCNICQKQSKPSLYCNISDVAISDKNNQNL